jgi:hypothetical protein
MGLKSKIAGFKITFDKTVYSMGEKMNITVFCDNSLSSKDLSHVMFELFQGYNSWYNRGKGIQHFEIASKNEGQKVFE